MNEGKTGYFYVKLNDENGRISARLTGEHFSPEEEDVARAMVSIDGAFSVMGTDSNGPPIYLVRDSVIRVASGAYGKALTAMISKCHDGPRGKPCGKCEQCVKAREDAFTMVVLAGLKLPEGELSGRIRSAVDSAIGMVWSDDTWNGPMTEDEVEDTFEKIGVSRM